MAEELIVISERVDDTPSLIAHMDADYIHPKGMGKYLERCPGIEHLYFAGQQAGYPGGLGNALGSGKRAGKPV